MRLRHRDTGRTAHVVAAPRFDAFVTVDLGDQRLERWRWTDVDHIATREPGRCELCRRELDEDQAAGLCAACRRGEDPLSW